MYVPRNATSHIFIRASMYPQLTITVRVLSRQFCCKLWSGHIAVTLLQKFSFFRPSRPCSSPTPTPTLRLFTMLGSCLSGDLGFTPSQVRDDQAIAAASSMTRPSTVMALSYCPVASTKTPVNQGPRMPPCIAQQQQQMRSKEAWQGDRFRGSGGRLRRGQPVFLVLVLLRGQPIPAPRTRLPTLLNRARDTETLLAGDTTGMYELQTELLPCKIAKHSADGECNLLHRSCC